MSGVVAYYGGMVKNGLTIYLDVVYYLDVANTKSDVEVLQNYNTLKNRFNL